MNFDIMAILQKLLDAIKALFSKLGLWETVSGLLGNFEF